MILDTFQAVGIIIVFVTLLFGMKYTAIVNALTEECPEGPKAKSSLKRRLRSSIATDCLPVLFLTSISLHVLLPLAVEILRLREVSIWSLDMLPFAYIVITLWVFGLAST